MEVGPGAKLVKAGKEPVNPPTQNTPAVARPPAVGVTPPAGPPAAAVPPGSAELPQAPGEPFSAFGSISQFRDAQRMATMLARSSIVPENFRGEEHLGDCVIALEIANRIGASILAVMQNLRLVQGKPGWSSQFLISCVNASRRFSPIRYQMTGTRGEDSWGCIAWAVDKTGELLRSPEVTIGTAKAEGWYHRPGSKWQTMPELMLCYRSATLFARLYAPEITMGLQTTEEVVEMGPEANGHTSRQVLESKTSRPKFEANSNTHSKQEVPINTVPQPTSALQTASEAQAASGALQAPVAPPKSGAAPQCQKGHYNYLKALIGLMALSKHSEADVLTFLRNQRKCDESLTSLAQVADQQPSTVVWVHDSWKSVDQELTRLKQEKAL